MKGSDLDLTIVKGAAASRAPLTGPACAYININLNLNNKEQEGVVLLENPKGENCLDMAKLRQVCSSIFGLNNTKLCVFNGKT
ncbi:unnamed protein product, partial [Coregonus sp. 'balchen']